MRRTTKKLSLSKTTLRRLAPGSLGAVAGALTGRVCHDTDNTCNNTHVPCSGSCPSEGACESQGCPTADLACTYSCYYQC
jgi:hypothetical protein